MYLHKINIENIRSIKKFILEFKPDECAGWHVLIGDNGTGKSTLVRAIALALAGAREAEALRQNWMDWLRNGESDGCITTDIKMDPKLDETAAEYIHPNLWFQRKESRNGAIVTISPHELKQNAVGEYDWREDTTGFCASYGPFRRFTGGNKELEKLFCSKPRLAPHLSIFGEEAALTECLEWLQILHVKQLENRIDGKILDDLRAFINKGRLLPHGVVLEKVTSDAVVFRDGSGCMLSVEQLSDGYRSILSMTFDLIRQLVRVYPAEEVFQHIRQGEMKIDLPG
ncbi:MAG: AAA family ATPase, partial [Gammaproteobacteria bacterium]|nr:AAA family ATPase [Gammaproteobacteria bacterium]